MTELRILLALAALFTGVLGYIVITAEHSPDARGCHASAGTWHIPQHSCTWPRP